MVNVTVSRVGAMGTLALLSSCYRGHGDGGLGLGSTSGSALGVDATAGSGQGGMGSGTDGAEAIGGETTIAAEDSTTELATTAAPITTGGDTGPGQEDAEGVCRRWNQDRADLAEGVWSGNIAACDPGDISAVGRDNALRLVNLYRWLAHLPAVTDDGSRNTMAQACALIMDANNELSHDPPMTWSCWSAQGAETAGNSNISSAAGVVSVDMYMVDFGNASTLGHRRWLLSNSLGPIGLGSTDGASCMWVLGGSGQAGAAWTAYPPAGPFPLEAFDPLPFGDPLDVTGWSIQSDSIELEGAQVTISVDGTDMPVAVTTLSPNYGSRFALSLIPQGWTAQAGTSYRVEVAGTPIVYDVDVVDCSEF